MSFSTLKFISSISAKAVKGGSLCSINKAAPIFLLTKRQESGLPPLTIEKINDNIQLQTLATDYSKTRPLVLLFGWMLAKQRHLNKYANLYHSKGLDVLTLQMKPGQVLVPTKAQDTMDLLLNVLQDSNLLQRPLIVHGFSVGGYMYGEMLVKLSQQRDTWSSIRQRLQGQIFDSPVDFEGVAPGFASVLVKNPLAQKMLHASIEGYLKLFKDSVTSHFIRSSQAFHQNELRLPTLLLYSRSDPIGVAHRIELVMKKWKQAGIRVSGRCWESSPHVSHFHRHPDEYVEAVLGFLDSIKFGQEEKVVKKRVVATEKRSHAEQQQAL